MQVLLPDWSVPDTEEHLEPLFCDLGEAVARRQVAEEAAVAAEAAEVHGVPADVVLAGPSAQHGAPGQGGDSNGGDSIAIKYGKGDSTATKYGKDDSAAAKYGKCDSTAARYGKGDAALPPRLLRGYPPAALARVLRLFGLTIGWYAAASDGLGLQC